MSPKPPPTQLVHGTLIQYLFSFLFMQDLLKYDTLGNYRRVMAEFHPDLVTFIHTAIHSVAYKVFKKQAGGTCSEQLEVC
jgi:hypothetical protein